MRPFRIAPLALAIVLSASVAHAALTTAQLATLKTAITQASDAVPAGVQDCGAYAGIAINVIPSDGDGSQCIARLFNLSSAPAFIVWRSSVSLNEVGRTFNATDLAGLSSLNTQRLQNLAAWLAMGINPSLASVRQFFDDVFSGAGGLNTRTALLAIWKRTATRFEKLFATGTGSDAVPATLVIEGAVAGSDISQARTN